MNALVAQFFILTKLRESKIGFHKKYNITIKNVGHLKSFNFILMLFLIIFSSISISIFHLKIQLTISSATWERYLE